MTRPKKDVQYKKEQEQTIKKMIEILGATETNTFVLYEVENNEDKIKKINGLTNDIKKYFPCKNIGGIKEPERFARPWLSVIRQVLKRKYKVITGDYTIKEGNIRTRIYHLMNK